MCGESLNDLMSEKPSRLCRGLPSCFRFSRGCFATTGEEKRRFPPLRHWEHEDAFIPASLVRDVSEWDTSNSLGTTAPGFITFQAYGFLLLFNPKLHHMQLAFPFTKNNSLK